MTNLGFLSKLTTPGLPGNKQFLPFGKLIRSPKPVPTPDDSGVNPLRIRLALQRQTGEDFAFIIMEAEHVSGELLIKIWPWLEANRKGLIIALIAIAVLATGLFTWPVYWEQRETEAGTTLSHLLMSSATTPEMLQQFSARESKTQAGMRAALVAGQTWFAKGQYPAAQGVFEKFVQDHPGTAMANEALFALAACQEAQGKFDLAATTYGRVSKSLNSEGSAPLAKFALGRLAERQGQWKNAQQYFEEVRQSVNPQLPLGNDALRHISIDQQQLAAQTPAPAAGFVPGK